MNMRQAYTETIATSKSKAARFWEIDALRGVAIIMMITFHLMWDLWFFRVLPNVVLYAGFWKYFQRTTAILFLLLVGVSLTVSYRRSAGWQHPPPTMQGWLMFAVRGLRIFGWGMAVSLAVWLAGIGYVHFGILHLIGVSIVLAYPLLRFRWLNLGLWAIFFLAGGWLQPLRVESTWLVWLGLRPAGYAPNDYFPLIPWFGVVLLGVFVGNTLYQEAGRLIPLPNWQRAALVRLLQWLGRHSLLIYLVHQPVLLAILFAVGLVRL